MSETPTHHWSTAKHGRTAHAWVRVGTGWVRQRAICVLETNPERYEINSMGPVDAPRCSKCERVLRHE